jgi:hypothetical protein
MTTINTTELRRYASTPAKHRPLEPDHPIYLKPSVVLALLDTVEAAQALQNDLDDAIAGADLEAWNAPYRIEAPLFRESADRLRQALARFTSQENT